jgi:hypothetical protein
MEWPVQVPKLREGDNRWVLDSGYRAFCITGAILSARPARRLAKSKSRAARPIKRRLACVRAKILEGSCGEFLGLIAEFLRVSFSHFEFFLSQDSGADVITEIDAQEIGECC